MSGAPSHAADDGSLARSTGGAAARGALLIALAVVIGLVLMAFALDDDGTEVTAGNGDDTPTETTVPDDDTGATGDDEDPADGDADGDNGATTTSEPATITTEDNGAGNPARPPAEVNVLVANGEGSTGVASRLSDKLNAVGYIGKASNAPSTADSVIYYRESYDGDARAVAEVIGATPEVILPAPEDIRVSQSAIADGRLAEANVIVIVGTDGRIPTS